jgi:CubicO group peptidase (beta-lactamase class C family)
VKKLLYILFYASVLGCNHPKASNESISDKSVSNQYNFRQLTPQEKEYYERRLKGVYDSQLLRTGFNGGIVVAKNGEILLEDYHGYADMRTKDSITPNTPFHIASVSKTFTAMAVLKLWEEHKLSLDDSIQHFFPQFPYHNITIRLLLSHRSGLPNYVYTMAADTAWKKKLATNNDMLQFLIDKHPTWYGYPNRGFHYCNTNYAMLALIVEKVTGQAFPEYMANTIFKPLGMKNTFIFSIKDTAKYHPSYQYNNAPFRLEPIDCIYGDKNVYSTPRDLYLWDRALYSNQVVRKDTYDEATKGYSFEKPGTHNYGLGWRLLLLPENHKVIYHNGWWHGNNACFTRLVEDTATVIILGNKFNRAIYAGNRFAPVFNHANKKTENEIQEE